MFKNSGIMEEIFVKAEELMSDVKDYVDNRLSSVKLNVAEKTSKVGSQIITAAIVAVIFIFFLVFASIALAFAFTRLTGEYYWGFTIVAGLYLLTGVVLLVAKEKIIRLPLLNALLNQLFKNDEED